MDRRTFLNWVGVGLLASSLPVAIAACSSQTTQAESTNNKGGFKVVGKVSQLSKNDRLLNKNSPVGAVLVVRTSPTSNLSAVNPTCTHKGCTVDWAAKSQKFVCPCHAAEYGIDGKVLKGPASQPLKTYKAKIEGDSVLVSS
ncbi:MAG: ubiquinol-cytochrome c reductase iron-sulfur subunit [Chroococcus sp. CMT-3BRIN-NPC107]|nr:ubiquinol-cytochrome c reductase iron-sulfur subunit [Chroococcus sp. CMT-3BRIN-NPC107]